MHKQKFDVKSVRRRTFFSEMECLKEALVEFSGSIQVSSAEIISHHKIPDSSLLCMATSTWSTSTSVGAKTECHMVQREKFQPLQLRFLGLTTDLYLF